MQRVNIAEIAASALSAYPGILERWLPGGRQHGNEFKCGSLQGEPGESLSINVRTGKWADFASGEVGGDPVSLFAAIHRLSQLEAAKQLATDLGMSLDAPRSERAPAATPKEVKHIQIIPAPETPPDVRHKLGKPVASWTYRTLEGGLIGYIHRFDKPDGKKDIIPQIYAADEAGNKRWVWKSFIDPRPLYNLPSLNNGSTMVLLVEGEKAADAAAEAFGARVSVLTWPGGSKATGKVDWKPLQGRKVLLWPDHDEAGFAAMQKVANTLNAMGCTVRFVVPHADAPDGWDVADRSWQASEIEAYVKAHLSEDLPAYQPPVSAFADEQVFDEPAPMVHDEPEAEQHHILNDAPFQCLGFDKEYYYYLAHGRQQISHLSPSAHTKQNLMGIADLNYWLMEFPKGKTGDIAVDAAANAMMRLCERRGVFQISKIRGRGAWYDDGRVCMHLGDRVIINQEQFAPSRVKSRYIYEAGETMRADFHNPLSNTEANKFVQLLEMLSWERPIYGKLAAGWCMVAHIGGVLKWRPHVWVVGRKGSGKTYVMNNIIRPVLGDNLRFVQAGSTEAGIRQLLANDALPVLFDEAEGEDYAAHQNIQRVLGLVRQSSSETGGTIAKGTPGGKALTFAVRSCFAFSSINANLVQQSDKSRVTVLELNGEKHKHDFTDITRAETELLTDEYIKRFYARALALAGIIRENAGTFARAAAAALGEQRAGDQIGALLAGCFALYSDKLVTFDAAVEFVNRQDWSEQRDEIAGQSDEHHLFGYLMQQKIRVKLDSQYGDEDLPIGLMVDAATYEKEYRGLDASRAKELLQRNGIRIEDSLIIISNQHPALAKMLLGTPWSTNWGKVLKRLAGAKTTETTYFGYKGSESRGVGIPLNRTQ